MVFHASGRSKRFGMHTFIYVNHSYTIPAV